MPFGLGQTTATNIPMKAMPSTAGAAIAHERADVVVGTANFWNIAFPLALGVMRSFTRHVLGMSDAEGGSLRDHRALLIMALGYVLELPVNCCL